MRLHSSILLLLAFGAGGCTTDKPSASRPAEPLIEEQPRLSALQHWQELADNMADELAQRGDLFKDGQTIYVQPSEFDTAFARAYHKFVLNAFQDRDIPFVKEPGVLDADKVLLLNFSVQNVRHTVNAPSGISVGVVEKVGGAVGRIIPTKPTAPPSAGDTEEVLVYTAVSDTQKDVFVNTQIAYINVTESHFYLEQKMEKPRSLGTQSIPVINEKKI